MSNDMRNLDKKHCTFAYIYELCDTMKRQCKNGQNNRKNSDKLNNIKKQQTFEVNV